MVSTNTENTSNKAFNNTGERLSNKLKSKFPYLIRAGSTKGEAIIIIIKKFLFFHIPFDIVLAKTLRMQLNSSIIPLILNSN